MPRFENNVVIVTGGSSGIGKAAALAFARAGARVVIANRNEKQGGLVVDQIKAEGGEAVMRQVDVQSAEEVEAMVAFTVERYGRIDAAFNNAGAEGDLVATTELTETNFEAVMNTNVKSTWLCLKHQITQMLKQDPDEQGRRGAIVNSSSAAGLIGLPGLSHYSASKHAIMGLTRCAALEYAEQGIRINAINPAVIDTPMGRRLASKLNLSIEQVSAMHPMGRLGTPEEVAAMVLHLCSNESSFTTGQATVIDGGYTAR